MKNKIIYSIAVDDIYTVAEDSLNRKPTKKEIQFVAKKIGDRIPWFDIIDGLLDEYESEIKPRKEKIIL